MPALTIPAFTPFLLCATFNKLLGTTFSQFVIPYNYSGSPSLCTPSGFTKDGLPLSIQFVGKHLSEPLLCQIGNAYEKLTGFTSAHPDV